MAIDLSKWSGERRAQLIRIGASESSEEVQRIADAFVKSLKIHAPAMYASGYSDADGKFIEDVCAESRRLCDERPEAARGKSEARRDLRRQAKAAKQLRLDSRVALESTLSAHGDDLDAKTRDDAQSILNETASAGADHAKLRRQLLALATLYEHPALAPLLASRGGADGAAKLKAQATSLEAAETDAQVGRGTVEQTSTLDLLDGLMLERLRSIRKVARRASTRTGDHAIAAAFSLDAID